MPLFPDAESASMSVDIPLQMNGLHFLKIRKCSCVNLKYTGTRYCMTRYEYQKNYTVEICTSQQNTWF